nr:methyl-accepting chemotaxis protein [uncultured Caproiciproducens sp.]
MKINKRKTWSIKGKLLVRMIGLTASVSILCGVIAGILLYQSSYQSMSNEVSMASKNYSESVEDKVQQYKMAIELIANNATITSSSAPEDEIRLEKERLAKKYGFLSVTTVDATGQTNVAGVNVADKDFFKQAITGKTYFSSPIYSKSDNSTVIYLSAKISNFSDFQGIVYATLSSDVFCNLVDNATIGKSGYSFITDKFGTIIAHRDRSVVNSSTNYIEKAKSDSSFSGLANTVKKIISGQNGTTTYTLKGMEYYTSYYPIKNTDGWSICVTTLFSEMMSNFYTSIYITLAIMILFIILSIFISLKTAKHIVEPIKALVTRTEMLAEGDLHSQIPHVNTKDEIEILSLSFSDTIDALKGYVGEISSIMNNLTAGDYSVETHQNYKGDFIAIKDALNLIISNSNEIFFNIKQSAERVSIGAEQVSDASQTLSQGATRQASSLEELSAAITEIADQVNKNASNAAQASQYSLDVSTEVMHENEQMQKMVDAMSDINDSSNEIKKIVKTIEDIAFQTNILALNAAVEAARAGSAGKGFAVVADEVRNLANKSGEATKNTTALIENSIKAVENGTIIADQMAKSLNEIVLTANKSSDLIGEISIASNSQATSINQITLGVDQISEVVQTNSASSEESAATSEELNGQAHTLKDMVYHIRLKDDTIRAGIINA